MRKRTMATRSRPEHAPADGWLDLERLAEVEITSEAPTHPVENALLPGSREGWRAAQGGAQALRIVFDAPQRLRRIDLLIEELEVPRTQELLLRWSPDGGRSWREIVRQQFTFSPPGTSREAESYAVEIEGMSVLELQIVPDISGGEARASLARLRLA